MYIQPNDYNVNMHGSSRKPNFWKRIKQKAFDALPSATFKDNTNRVKKWGDYNEAISNPAKNRLIMGVTALATQPAIDYYNHKVDKETREVSRIRTIAKIVAGTAVGVAVRGTCHDLVKKMTNINGNKKYSKKLLPEKYITEFTKNTALLKNYRSALSTSLAILVMCITNFAIDAPLTVFLTNYMNEKRIQKLVKGGKHE